MTHELPSKDSQFVNYPEFLDAQTNVLDQPPFNWVREEIPDGYLGEGAFAWFLGKLARTPTDFIIKGYSDAHREFNPLFTEARRTQALVIAEKVAKELDQHYPHWRTYLTERLTGGWYEINGEPARHWEKIGGSQSYAAYEAAYLNMGRGLASWDGLSEELPHGATNEDATHAVAPGKGKVNRTFRIQRALSLKITKAPKVSKR